MEGERRGGREEGEKSEGEVRRRRRTCREWEAVRIWNVREVSKREEEREGEKGRREKEHTLLISVSVSCRVLSSVFLQE